MSPRKTILRELSRHHGETGGEYTRPTKIPGFTKEPEKYQKAVNELLSARLVSGHKDDEGHMAIGLNAQRLQEVKRELRPMWARPTVWFVIAMIVVAVGASIYA